MSHSMKVNLHWTKRISFFLRCALTHHFIFLHMWAAGVCSLQNKVATNGTENMKHRQHYQPARLESDSSRAMAFCLSEPGLYPRKGLAFSKNVSIHSCCASGLSIKEQVLKCCKLYLLFLAHYHFNILLVLICTNEPREEQKIQIEIWKGPN